MNYHVYFVGLGLLEMLGRRRWIAKIAAVQVEFPMDYKRVKVKWESP